MADAFFSTTSWHDRTYNPCGCDGCCTSAWSYEELCAFEVAALRCDEVEDSSVADVASTADPDDEWVLVPGESGEACVECE